MDRAMLDESGTPTTLCGEATFTAINILNKANVWVNSHQTPYELWYGKPLIVKHFKFFGRKCFIKNTNEKLGSLNPDQMKEFFLFTHLELRIQLL